MNEEAILKPRELGFTEFADIFDTVLLSVKMHVIQQIGLDMEKTPYIWANLHAYLEYQKIPNYE